MYKKSYIKLNECMLNENTELLFKYTIRCNDELLFYKFINSSGYSLTTYYSELGAPISKVYNGKSHLMTFDMTQSVVFSDIDMKDMSLYK